MRPREIMSLSTSDSRCGEIFVSNKADKWTFFCSFCQKATSDIGVFICHIRLDHLGGLLDCQSEKENMTPEEEESNFPVLSDSQPMPSLPPGTLLPRDEEQDTNIHLIKEETLSQYSYNSDELPARTSKLVEICSVTDSSETGNAFSAKNSTASIKKPASIDSDAEKKRCHLAQENRESEIKAEADGFASTKSKNLVTQTTYLPEQENVLENRESEIKNETDEFVSTKSRDPVTEAHYLHVEPEKSDIDSIQSKSNEEINKIVSITVVQPEIEIKQENPAIGEETNDESITIDDDENFNNTDASSVHTTINEDNVTTNEDDIDMENKDYNKASGSRSEEEVLVHKCGLCDLKFVSAKTVTDHLEFSHAIVETEMRYECKECRKKFRNLSGLRYHLQTHHKVAVCQVPLRKYYFMTHILAHQPHHLITRLKPAPQYVCQYCQTPNEVGTQNAPYICTNCGSSPKKYRPSEDSIPKAQIKTSKPLGKNLYK